jgi:hypothetical protein
MTPAAILKRFEEKFPFMYFLVVGIGGGNLFVFLMRRAHILFIAPELGRVFDCITVVLAMLWIIWRIFKYAFR